LIFTKGGRTDDVLFYDVQADGFSLDDKRQEISDNDLPDVLTQFQEHRTASADFRDRTAKAFTVPVADIRANKYDLSINRYKESVHKETKFDPPAEILGRMKSFEAAILADMAALEELL
jgi:type I restriction enzyme M protein